MSIGVTDFILNTYNYNNNIIHYRVQLYKQLVLTLKYDDRKLGMPII